MAPLQPKLWDDLVRDYARSHQHPVNRLCHTFGIPLVAGAVALAPVGLFVPELAWVAAGAFVVGWVFQFVGHAFEGKAPAFMRGWRFLLVGVLWWFQKLRGRA
jgi:uncharacterized membrane protein YGL010W